MSLVVAGLDAGCSGGSQSSPPAVTKAATTAGGLTLTLTESRASITPGQSVAFTLTLTNTSGAPITYTPEDGCPYTVLLPGTESYVETAGASASQDYQFASEYPSPCNSESIYQAVTLAPGASLTASVSSGSALSKVGIYTVTANVGIYIGDALGSPPTGALQNLAVGPLQIVVQ